MGIFERLQRDIGAALEADAALTYVPVHLVRPRDEGESMLVQDAVDQALAGLTAKNGKAGMAVLVFAPEGEVREPNTPGPAEELVIVVRVIENKLVNMASGGTEIPAEELGQSIKGLLHQRSFGSNVLYSDRRASVPVAVDDDTLNVWEYRFRQQVYAQPVTKAAIPVLTRHGDNVTIHSATGSADIYYTLDGSLPWSGNDAATLYSGAVDVSGETAGTVMRAAAFKAGLSMSNVASLTL